MEQDYNYSNMFLSPSLIITLLLLLLQKIFHFSIFFCLFISLFFFILKQRLSSTHLIKSWRGERKNAQKALLNRKQCFAATSAAFFDFILPTASFKKIFAQKRQSKVENNCVLNVLRYKEKKRHKRHRFHPWFGKIPWRRAQQPTLVFLPGESPWTENLGGLLSVRSRRVRYD